MDLSPFPGVKSPSTAPNKPTMPIRSRYKSKAKTWFNNQPCLRLPLPDRIGMSLTLALENAMRIRSYEKEADFYELCDLAGILPSISKLTVNRQTPRRFTVEFHADENDLFALRDGIGLRDVTNSLIESERKDGYRVYALDHSLSPFQMSGGREFVEVILYFTEPSQTASLELVYSATE